MILEAIAQQRHPGWFSSAAVCKEWQLVIEKRNFQRLKLQVSCLDDFERLVVRQRKLVRHILLDIELQRYTCRCCRLHESHTYTDRNRSVVNNGISKLFRILSTWEPGHGLTLELNAHSPSDSDHWFKHYHFSSDDGGNEDEPSMRETDRNWHDPRHHWVHGQQVRDLPLGAIERLFKCIPIFRFWPQLPRVDAVTCFIIRRQLRRHLFPYGLHLILTKLGRLEHLIYEPWRQWKGERRAVCDERGYSTRTDTCAGAFEYSRLLRSGIADFVHLIRHHLPQTLKRVTVFEDFNDSLAAVLVSANIAQVWWLWQVEASRVVDAKVGAAFASKSLGLEQLAVSYMVNAEDFFRACQPTWTWQRLQSLALTTQLLRPTGSRQEIDALLYEAGLAALRMPKLRTLVLWNGGRENACAFIFHVDGHRASVTWRGTWDMGLSRRVVEVWERVASERQLCVLRFSKEQVCDAIGSHGDAIHHLGLPVQVVTPISLWQIRRETSLDG
jgi:hypothetical protein